MKEYNVPVVPPSSSKNTSPNTSAAAEPNRKKSYHSMVVPIMLAPTTLPIPVRSDWPGLEVLAVLIADPFSSAVLSGGGPAAGNLVGRAAHRAAARAAEKQRQPGDLGGFDEPFHRDTRQQHVVEHLFFRDAVAACLVRQLLPHQRGPHVSGADRVGRDAVRSTLHRQHLRQPLHRVL